MAELPPPEQRLYSFEEVVMLLDGWHKDWYLDADHESNEDGVRGWVEHMDAGGFSVGIRQQGEA